MRVAPPAKVPKPRPFALLTPGWRTLLIETDTGTDEVRGPLHCHEALERLSDHALYVDTSLGKLRHTTGATGWTAHAWRGRVTRMTLDGTKVSVTSLRGTLENADDPFGDLSTALGWLHGHGVRPASISSMGWALWRSTLQGPLQLAAPPPLGASALYGSRQEVREPRTYQHMVATDIGSAYPHSMACRPYAVHLRRVAASTLLDPSVAGIVTGTMGVPDDMPYGPVPYRLAPDMITFPRGIFEGSWPWCEAWAAVQLGCDLRVSECWAPTREVALFERWWALVAEGRQLPGAAGRIAKAVANTLWGLFGMKGDDRELVKWSDEGGQREVRVSLTAQRLPHLATAHIAAETAARVRVRTLLEGIYGYGSRPVHVDTDGVIVRRSAMPVQGNKGATAHGKPGEWRTKARMPKVEIRAPQVYRYTCGTGCGVTHSRWHYVASGVPQKAAPELFERFARTNVGVSFGGLDVVVPGGNVANVKSYREAAMRARAIAGGMG